MASASPSRSPALSYSVCLSCSSASDNDNLIIYNCIKPGLFISDFFLKWSTFLFCLPPPPLSGFSISTLTPCIKMKCGPLGGAWLHERAGINAPKTHWRLAYEFLWTFINLHIHNISKSHFSCSGRASYSYSWYAKEINAYSIRLTSTTWGKCRAKHPAYVKTWHKRLVSAKEPSQLIATYFILFLFVHCKAISAANSSAANNSTVCLDKWADNLLLTDESSGKKNKKHLTPVQCSADLLLGKTELLLHQK